tara:strand:- start:455 stop:1798 length:1344 start_codon:yes stop_codon:yes gene_type:complete
MSNQEKRNAMKRTRELQRERKDKITEFLKNNEGFSYREAEIELFEGGIPTITNDNGDKVKLELKSTTIYRNSSKGPRVKGVDEVFVDTKGNIYDKEGILIERSPNDPAPVDFDSIRKKRLARYGKRRQGGVLRYPAELLTEHTDYLQIDIERYAEIGKSYISDTGGSSRYVIGNASQNRAGRTRKLSRRPLINAGTILLPIPAQLQDTNNVVYGDSKMNGLAAAGVQALEGTMSTVGGQLANKQNFDISDNIETFRNDLKSGLGGDKAALTTAADVLTKKLASEAVNIFGANVTVNQLLARGSGEILNPNMELLFSDVTIRNFRFSFKLTPRNAREAEQVKLIIRAFKRNMAPQAQGGVSGSGNFFLRAPNVFKLRYRSGAKDHPFLNKFKQCFLTDMQTTYTADGVYSTYEDGTPVSMQLDLSFKELQPIYDLDYDTKPGDGAVGY